MGTVTAAVEQELGDLTEKAIISLNRASEDLVAWCDVVRDPEMPWAFRWAEESTRVAQPCRVCRCRRCKHQFAQRAVRSSRPRGWGRSLLSSRRHE